MIDAGWNPLIQISQSAGETMEETQKRMSAGAISVQELQSAMEAVTTGTGQFAGGMESASQTTQGLISTLQDNVKSKIGEAFQSVSNILQSEVLPRAIEFVNSVNVDSVIESVNGLVSTFVELSPVIAAATTATLAYKAAVSISGVIDAVKKATEGQTLASRLPRTPQITRKSQQRKLSRRFAVSRNCIRIICSKRLLSLSKPSVM